MAERWGWKSAQFVKESEIYSVAGSQQVSQCRSGQAPTESIEKFKSGGGGSSMPEVKVDEGGEGGEPGSSENAGLEARCKAKSAVRGIQGGRHGKRAVQSVLEAPGSAPTCTHGHSSLSKLAREFFQVKSTEMLADNPLTSQANQPANNTTGVSSVDQLVLRPNLRRKETSKYR